MSWNKSSKFQYILQQSILIFIDFGSHSLDGEVSSLLVCVRLVDW